MRDGDSYVLNGSKMFISGGGRSDVYAIMARTADTGPSGISCFLVPAPSAGLTFGKQERKLGWRTQPTSAVFLENVRVPAENRLGKEGDGFRIAMRGLNGGRCECPRGGACAGVPGTGWLALSWGRGARCNSETSDDASP